MAKNTASSDCRSATEPKKGRDVCKAPYEEPQLVSLKKGGTKGCKNGNQVTGNCTTGGYPEGELADCRNGAFAAEATCNKGSSPGVT